MLFKPQISPDVVTIPSQYAKLLRVYGEPGSRSFIYRFTFSIDITQAVRSDALFLEVRLLAKKPEKSKVKPAAVSTKSFKKSTKRLEKAAQKKVKTRKAQQFAYLKTEITDAIPNENARWIASGRLAYRRPVKRKTVPILNSELYTLPLSGSLPRRKRVSLQKVSNAFVSTRRDPAQIVSSRRKSRFKKSRPDALSFLGPSDAMLAQKVMFRETKKEVVPKIFTVFLRNAKLKRMVRLSEKRLKSRSTFYLHATLRSSKGVVVGEAGVVVSHAKILNDFLTPTKPPALSVSQLGIGELSVGVTQLDSKASRVKLFRRLAPTDNSAGTGWVSILDTDLDVGDGEIRFRDKVATASPVMYRATAVGANSRPTEEFSSTVITPRQEVKLDYSGKGTATAKLESNVITTTVTDFPKNAISVALRRYNLTNNSYSKKQAQTGSGFTLVGSGSVDDQIQSVTSEDDVVSFRDKPLPGSMYKYVPLTYTLYGKEVLGKAAIIDFIESQEDNKKVDMKVGSATLTSTQNSKSVSFSIAGSFTEFGFEEIEATLSDANQAGLFGGDVSSNRDKFSSLIVFLVERENFKTGEVESFGSQEAGTFTDSQALQQEKNVKPLAAGTRYAYKVTACIRPADTLFPDLVTTEIHQTTVLSFSRSVQKFRGPMQLRKSTLASTARQLDANAPSALEPIDPFLAGKTAVQVTTEIAVPNSITKGSSATVEKRMDNNLIKWSYIGDMARLDHFQVFLTSAGGFELLGTVHADSSSMNFSYRHFINREIPYNSSYAYEIRPINISFKELSSLRTTLIPANPMAGLTTKELRNVRIIQR